MFLPRFKILASSVVVVAVLASIQLTQAKRGCAAFGHSCFGGHGKRSDATLNPSDGEEGQGGLQPPTDDLRTFIVNDGPRTSDEIFSRDQPDNDLNLIIPSQYREPEEFMKFSPLFRKWLVNSYRRGDLVSIKN